MVERGVRTRTGVPRDGKAHEQNGAESADHHECRPSDAVEVAGKATGEGEDERFERRGPQELGGCGDDGRLVREDAGEDVAAEDERGREQYAGYKRGRHADENGASCARHQSGTRVLGDEGRNRLDVGHRDEEDEERQPFRNANAGRDNHAEGVDEADDDEIRRLVAQVLEGDRRTDAEGVLHEAQA